MAISELLLVDKADAMLALYNPPIGLSILFFKRKKC